MSLGLIQLRRGAWPCSLAVAVFAWATAPARATFHEISIREIYPGSAALSGSEYVELQMWTPGQNLVGGHWLKTYSATGAVNGTTTFASKVPGGASQSTILLATPLAESEFGIGADATMSPDQLDPAGGAVCWEALDCVSWGNFSGPLPSPAGSPAVATGIPDGMALRRTISPGCATLLEATDDRDNSGADFSAVFPSPRSNSTAPSERACGASGGGTNASAGERGAPQTRLTRKPSHRTHDRTPSFRFISDEAGSRFECKLDRKPFSPCRSPFTAKRLRPGPHSFKVRALDDSDELDPSPAAYVFSVAVGNSQQQPASRPI